jgi:NAD(P)-dependent dehydrogenase (short-subunit alcohol dehydrogenase family)
MSKVILITGTSTGFGRDAATTLAQAGHRVFASMRDIGGRNQAQAESLRARKIEVVELDVTNDASVERGVASVLQAAGRIDVLINNAGVGATGISEAYTTNQMRDLFEVNVFGIQRTLRAALPALRKQGDGLVINIGSVLGRVTMPFGGLYGATKFALDAMTQSYRYELSPFGVEVTLVQPSAYPTDIWSKSIVPSDAACIQSYGDLVKVLDSLGAGIGQMLSGENAPDAHDVAEALLTLIGEPKGSRPARVVVGNSFGADLVNETATVVQTQALNALGLSALLPASDSTEKGPLVSY